MVIAASSVGPQPLPSGTRRAVAAIGTALAAAMILAATALGYGLLFPALGFAAYLAISGIVLRQVGPHHRHAIFGSANVVTLLRAGIASFTCGFLAEETLAAPLADPERWAVIALLFPALLLDGLDGFLARRHNLTSGFGARFDMETDAFLLLLLCTAAAATDSVGAWILAIGALRYLFWGGGVALPWLAQPLPASLRRKTVCVAQFVLLLAILLPFADSVALPLAQAALGLLVWSFGLDVAWLWRRRAPARSAS